MSILEIAQSGQTDADNETGRATPETSSLTEIGSADNCRDGCDIVSTVDELAVDEEEGVVILEDGVIDVFGKELTRDLSSQFQRILTFCSRITPIRRDT